ncbi:hypothetical protein PMAYCL1PPCAC_27619 [Pristionchus mayeri]|uniref:Uncharacterized protein n=1 Tax=Pristionchus mayeri TaxID=1317129 RepID=A0AAN5D6N8_9BILA|nr:hypothetical protein PMAYCL1PPCAC_27619 [Pristionchus mayeri]
MLLAAKPKSLTLGFLSDSRFINESFLIDFVTSSPLSHLTIYDESDSPPPTRVANEFASVLSEFGSLHIANVIVVDTDWFLEPLVKRLQHGLNGEWRLSITEDITDIDIQRFSMPSDVSIASNRTHEEERMWNGPFHAITLKHSDHQVVVNIFYPQDPYVHCTFRGSHVIKFNINCYDIFFISCSFRHSQTYSPIKNIAQ